MEIHALIVLQIFLNFPKDFAKINVMMTNAIFYQIQKNANQLMIIFIMKIIFIIKYA